MKSQIKYVAYALPFLFAQNAYADHTTDFKEVCENVASNYISEFIHERANNKDKQSLKAEFSQNIRKGIESDNLLIDGIENAFLSSIDTIYSNNPVSLVDPEYIGYVDDMEQSTISDCVKRLQIIERQYEKNRFKNVVVTTDCGYGCYLKDIDIQKQQAPIRAIIDNNSYHSSYISGETVAGRYYYDLYFKDNSMPCSGSFEVKDTDKQITLYVNKRDCNLTNIYRYPN